MRNLAPALVKNSWNGRIFYSYGFEVFEDKNRFNQWMLKPNKALGGQVPYDLFDNQFCREEVKNLIGRIDYGIYC